jgi:hypothetical protein
LTTSTSLLAAKEDDSRTENATLEWKKFSQGSAPLFPPSPSPKKVKYKGLFRRLDPSLPDLFIVGHKPSSIKQKFATRDKSPALAAQQRTTMQ